MGRPQKLPDGMWKRGKVYYARFRANGQLIRKKLSSDRDAACEMLRDLRARADKAGAGILDNDYLWQDIKAEYLRWAKQQIRDWKDYEEALAKFEEYQKVRSVRQITHDYILGFRKWRLDQGVTPRTINKQVSILSGMMTKAVQWGRIGFNPVRGLAPLKHDVKTKTRRSLTVEEVQSLLENSSPELRPVWFMFLTTGIRRRELVEMRFSDIDFDRHVFTTRAEFTKNRKPREIPICDEMMATLRQLRDDAPFRVPGEGRTPKEAASIGANFSKEHVFVSLNGTPLRHHLLNRFYTACRKAGIEVAGPTGDIDIHSLRVSFVTLSIENGGDPKSVQEILGHSTLALTMGVYAKARGSAKRSAVNALPFATVSEPLARDVINIDEARKQRA